MIYPSKHNGIDFSNRFNRSGNLQNFDLQRSKYILPRATEIKHLSFYWDSQDPTDANLQIISKSGVQNIEFNASVEEGSGTWIFFKIWDDELVVSGDFYMAVKIDGDIIYSEICSAQSTDYLLQNNIVHVTAKNENDKYGQLSREAFGFFRVNGLNTDIFLNKATVYEYSYNRKKILASENQIGKRLIFERLTMHQRNLIKWLANCNEFKINGVQYQLISEFSDVANDANSEIGDLQADFVEVAQKFYEEPSLAPPKNIFENNFFN